MRLRDPFRFFGARRPIGILCLLLPSPVRREWGWGEGGLYSLGLASFLNGRPNSPRSCRDASLAFPRHFSAGKCLIRFLIRRCAFIFEKQHVFPKGRRGNERRCAGLNCNWSEMVPCEGWCEENSDPSAKWPCRFVQREGTDEIGHRKRTAWEAMFLRNWGRRANFWEDLLLQYRECT